MKKYFVFIILLMLYACTEKWIVHDDPTAVEYSDVRNYGDTVVCTFDNFTAIGNPPDAIFNTLSLIYYTDTSEYVTLVFQMGYNEIFQSDAEGRLWIIQYENGYAYALSPQNNYELLDMTLIYLDGYCEPVGIGLDNRNRITHFFGYNPIVKINATLIRID